MISYIKTFSVSESILVDNYGIGISVLYKVIFCRCFFGEREGLALVTYYGKAGEISGGSEVKNVNRRIDNVTGADNTVSLPKGVIGLCAYRCNVRLAGDNVIVSENYVVTYDKIVFRNAV